MDKLTPQERSENMRRIASKNTKPEMFVRSLVHGMGFRYRLHGAKLPGNPDLVFKSRKKAIFVHGCFWHKHEGQSCKIWRVPKSRVEYWLDKLNRNKVRDSDNERKLREMGWDILVIWECQLKEKDNLILAIQSFLDG